jgi:hypothetical protein
MYHSVASSSSSFAAGWKLTAVMQTSVKLCADFFPRDGLHLAGVDLAHPALDLLSPSRFDPFVRLTGKRFEEAARKLGAIGFRQVRCLSQELCYITWHGRIVPRCEAPFWHIVVSIAIAIAVIVKHHSNIARIVDGTERKLGQKKGSA